MSALRPNDIATLMALFAENDWYKVPHPSQWRISARTLFSAFGCWLAGYEGADRDMLLALCRDFQIIPDAQYIEPLMRLFDAAVNYPIDATVAVVPARNFNDVDSPKSKGNDGLPKLVRNFFRHEHVRVIALASQRALRTADWSAFDHVVLVDDFSGSGKTLREAYTWTMMAAPAVSPPVEVVSVVGTTTARLHLKSSGVPHRFGKVLAKGISDNPAHVAAGFVARMEKIESRMKTSKRFRFGFGRTECLVCMSSVPNNTFPVFWQTQPAASIPPFERPPR